MSVIGLLGWFFFLSPPSEKKKLFKHLRVKRRAQSFQYRFVQSCHPFARIQMVEHSSPWTVRNPLDLATLAPHSSLVSFSTVRLKALWSVCGHRCRRHSGSGFWKCVAHRSSTLCVSSGVSDMQFRIKPYGTVQACTPRTPVCAGDRLSNLDIFRCVRLYIGTLNAISLSLILRNPFGCLLKMTENYTSKTKYVFLAIRIIDVFLKTIQFKHCSSYFILNYSTTPYSWAGINQRTRILPKMSVNYVPGLTMNNHD